MKDIRGKKVVCKRCELEFDKEPSANSRKEKGGKNG